MRELSHHTSRYLAEVKKGRILDITEHGKVIAHIVPDHVVIPPKKRVKIGGYHSGSPTTEDDVQRDLAEGFGL